MDGYMQKVLSTSKLAPNWKGTYFIKEVYDSGYFRITELAEELLSPVNAK